MPKLIIIRGNSGAGKSSLAKGLREQLTGQKVALIGQDHLRRTILKEKDKPDKRDILELVKVTVQCTLGLGYLTVLEGIFAREKYQDMIQKLIDENPDPSYLFYLDVYFEETLRRHSTKPNAQEFGEAEMKEWFHEDIALELEGEIRLPEHLSLADMIAVIRQTIQE